VRANKRKGHLAEDHKVFEDLSPPLEIGLAKNEGGDPDGGAVGVLNEL